MVKNKPDVPKNQIAFKITVNIDDKLFRDVVLSGGVVDVGRSSNDLNVTIESLETQINNLKKKGETSAEGKNNNRT